MAHLRGMVTYHDKDFIYSDHSWAFLSGIIFSMCWVPSCSSQKHKKNSHKKYQRPTNFTDSLKTLPEKKCSASRQGQISFTKSRVLQQNLSCCFFLIYVVAQNDIQVKIISPRLILNFLCLLVLIITEHESLGTLGN